MNNKVIEWELIYTITIKSIKNVSYEVGKGR